MFERFVQVVVDIVKLGLEMQPHGRPECIGVAGPEDIVETDVRDQRRIVVVLVEFRDIECEQMPQDALEVHQTLVAGHLEQGTVELYIDVRQQLGDFVFFLLRLGGIQLILQSKLLGYNALEFLHAGLRLVEKQEIGWLSSFVFGKGR